MKVIPLQKPILEWTADVTVPTGERTVVVCSDARALLDFVVRHIGPLDEASRKSAAIWLEIQNRKGHVLTIRSRRGGRAMAKLGAIYRLEVT